MEDLLVRIRTGLASNNSDDVSKAYRLCFVAFRHRMFFVATTVLRDNELARDAVQEAFAVLWLQPQKLRGITKLGAYFNGTVKNICLKILKVRAKQEEAAAQYQRQCLEPSVPDLLEPAGSTDSAGRLTALIGNLPENKRQMMYLKFNDKLPLIKIAEKLGMTEDAVARQVYRIRKELLVKMNS